MTQDEIKKEYAYRYEERLAIMCGTSEPTDEQKSIARQEALLACRALKDVSGV